MKRTTRARLLAGAAATLLVGTATALAVELSDEDLENLVERSYQNVAMNNVNNKFAPKQGGWNSCDPDTEMKDHTQDLASTRGRENLEVGDNNWIGDKHV